MKRPCGFTIIEVMITVAVIAILAVIGFIGYGALRARAMDAKLETEAAQLARHLDSMIIKYGSQDEVVSKLASLETYSTGRRHIRNYLNMGDFAHIKMQYLVLYYNSPYGTDENGFPGHICIGRLSDDCSASYYRDQDKDKVFLEILTSEDALYNEGSSQSCTSGGSTAHDSLVYIVIRYHSHLHNKLVDYKTYHTQCR